MWVGSTSTQGKLTSLCPLWLYLVSFSFLAFLRCLLSSSLASPRLGDSSALPLILCLFPHESTSRKVHRADRSLPAARQLRPDRTTAAAVARTSQAAHGSARQPQRELRYSELERAHAHHRPPERALPRSDPRLPQSQ